MKNKILETVAAQAKQDLESKPEPYHWGDFVLAEGFLDFWEASNNDEYLSAARGMIDRYMTSESPAVEDTPFFWAGMALPALRFYQKTDEEKYRAYGLERTANLREAVATAQGGIVVRSDIRELWIDMLHFSCPAYCERAEMTGEHEYFDAATEQFKIYVDCLIDENTGLFYHSWVEETGAHSECLWSRGNGWLTVAAVEMLAKLPGNHPDRSFVDDTLQRQLSTLVDHQDSSGHWHTIIDRADSKLETSGAAIIGLAILRGIRLGVIDKSHLLSAERAWEAVKREVDDNGRLTGVTDSTPPGDFEHYNGLPGTTTGFGTGLFLQLGVEMESTAS